MAYPFWHDVLREFFGLDINLPIPVFGSFVGLAFLIAIVIAQKEITRHIAKGTQFNDFNVSDFGAIAMISGIIGARVFHILEYPSLFIKDPLAMIFSTGGYTIYGGLLFGLIACSFYLKQRNISIPKMADIFAPSLMLGYGIGRLGCHFSGDGDWGIASNISLKPYWLPDWLWASTYENNVVGQFIPSPGVYPTPIYEALMAIVAFTILWFFRKHQQKSGWLFSLYLVLNGIERFAIEQIRVNSVYNFIGLEFTQAEMIATGFMIVGTAGLIYFSKLFSKKLLNIFGLGFILIAANACSQYFNI